MWILCLLLFRSLALLLLLLLLFVSFFFWCSPEPGDAAVFASGDVWRPVVWRPYASLLLQTEDLSWQGVCWIVCWYLVCVESFIFWHFVDLPLIWHTIVLSLFSLAGRSCHNFLSLGTSGANLVEVLSLKKKKKKTNLVLVLRERKLWQSYVVWQAISCMTQSSVKPPCFVRSLSRALSARIRTSLGALTGEWPRFWKHRQVCVRWCKKDHLLKSPQAVGSLHQCSFLWTGLVLDILCFFSKIMRCAVEECSLTPI